jgi:hypothetical protein
MIKVRTYFHFIICVCWLPFIVVNDADVRTQGDVVQRTHVRDIV